LEVTIFVKTTLVYVSGAYRPRGGRRLGFAIDSAHDRAIHEVTDEAADRGTGCATESWHSHHGHHRDHGD
jgi:hypothetical protein